MNLAIGIRQLKSNLAQIIRKVRAGQVITVTHRSQPVALILPYNQADHVHILHNLASAGRVSWAGGKPKGLENPPEVSGESVSDAVIEDRR